jgi:predicted MFS family arabinose efflux permease
MGLMLEISRGLSISETQVGHLISAYAIGVVVGARSSPSSAPASRAASCCWH